MDTITNPVRSAPRWAVAAAYAVPICILPSAIWRAGATFDGRLTGDGTPAWYPLLLSALSLGLGLLTLGLVHSWGQRVPRWVPRIGDRPIPVRAAVIPAVVGSTLLLGLVGWAVYHNVINPFEQVDPGVVLLGDADDLRPMREKDPAMEREVTWAYSPMAAWPVLLLAVTYAYYRRRTSNNRRELMTA
jgi:hypothetical protein